MSLVRVPHDDFLHSIYFDLFIAFYWAGFTVALRERAQEDFNVPYKGAHLTQPPIHVRKTATAPGSSYIFSNSVWVLLHPTELSTFKELWDGTSGLSSLPEKTRKSDHLQMKLQRQHFLLSYLKTLSVGPVGVSNSRPPAWQPERPQIMSRRNAVNHSNYT